MNCLPDEALVKAGLLDNPSTSSGNNSKTETL